MLAGVCLPAAAQAELPLEHYFLTVANRLGVQTDLQQQVIAFAQELQNDMLVDCSLTSVYPPVLDISFASGKMIHADGMSLQLIEAADRVIYADAVCPVLVILSGILFWAGLFLFSLPLFVAGIEFFIITAIICL